MSQIKVLMLGESLSRQGGIVSVQKLILDEMPSSVQFKHIATLVDGSNFQKSQVFLDAILKLFWTLLSQDVDLIHTHISERGSAFRQAITTCVALLFRKPVIMHTHGAEFHIFYKKLPALIQKILSTIFRRCAQFIVLSEYWKGFYTQTLGLDTDKVTVLPNAVRVPPKIPCRANSDIVSLVFLGRIGQRKGAFDLLEAFAGLSEIARSRAKLILAGDGELEQAQALAQSLELTDSVEFLGWIDEEQRNQILEDVDLFVLPSYNEGLPMAILEAMAWGLPIISTPVGGIPELVIPNKNGLLVEPGDTRALTSAMDQLIKDEELRLSLGATARNTVSVFDVKHYCSLLTEIYTSVIEHRTQEKMYES